MSESQFDKLAQQVEQLICAGESEEALGLLARCSAGTGQPLPSHHQQLQILKGRALADGSQWPEAIACLKQATEIEGDHVAAAFYWLGNTYREIEDISSACSCYQRALELAPKMAEAWINMGSMLDDVGQHEWALRCYACALEIDDRDAITWSNRGNSERELERFSEAANSYQQALKLKADCFEAQLGLAVCQVQLNEAEGLARLQEIFESSRSPLALFELATAQSVLGLYTEALDGFEQLLCHGVEEPALWNNRGQCLACLGRSEEALQSFNRALEADPFFEAAYVGKTQMLVSQSQLEAAREVVSQLQDFCSEQFRNSATFRHLVSLVSASSSIKPNNLGSVQ